MKKGLILGMFSASLMLASCGGIGGGTTTQGNQGNGSMSVSYTHLTLPTIA